MTTTPLSDETLKQLLHHDKPKTVFDLHCDCGTRLDNGYCRNEACPIDAPEPTYPCDACGHCERPNKCVQSFSCPKCGAGRKELCKEGTRLVGFHSERWDLVEQT